MGKGGGLLVPATGGLVVALPNPNPIGTSTTYGFPMPTTLEETRAEAEASGERVIAMRAALAATTIGSTLGPAPAVPPLSGAGNLKSTVAAKELLHSAQQIAAAAAERKISGVKAIPYGSMPYGTGPPMPPVQAGGGGGGGGRSRSRSPPERVSRV